MGIMELGAIGELVGGVAVIASLIFVGLQVRQSNDHSRQSIDMERNQANRSMTQAMADVVATLEEAEFVDLVQRASRDWETLSLADQGRVASWITRLHTNTVSIFLAGENGLMDEEFSSAWTDFYIMFIASPGFRRWWALTKVGHHPDFVAHVDARINEGEVRTRLELNMPWYTTAVA